MDGRAFVVGKYSLKSTEITFYCGHDWKIKNVLYKHNYIDI